MAQNGAIYGGGGVGIGKKKAPETGAFFGLAVLYFFGSRAASKMYAIIAHSSAVSMKLIMRT